MFTTPTTNRFEGTKRALIRIAPHVRHYLMLTFFQGPKQLLTSRISPKCAAIMAAMCAPSLLFCSLLTIPAMIFQSPYQNAYFQFSHVLEGDSTRWIVLFLAGICAIMSLAVPATMPAPRDSEFSLY